MKPSSLLQTFVNHSKFSPIRRFATRAPPKPNQLNVFDRNAKLLQREAAVRNNQDSNLFDYLKEEVGFILSDRVLDIKRDLDVVLDLGCGKGHVLKHLHSNLVGTIIATDRSATILSQCEVPEGVNCQKIVMDEENILFPNNKFDLVVSSLNLHWVNELPKTLFKINQILKPDGVFLGAMFGGQTLYELRCSLQLSECEREGGMAAHVSPFAQIQDIGGLLTINGFTMLTIDTQEIKVGYPSMFELMDDLKGMGESNASWTRKLRLNKDTLFAASAVYKEMYGDAEKDGIPATFHIIFMIAWKPDPSQPKPLPQQKPEVSFKNLGDLR